VATSLGSMVVTEWSAQYPKDFDAMILIAPSYKGICKMKERMVPGIRKEVLKVPLTKNLEKKEARLLKINSNDHACFEENHAAWVNIQTSRPMSTKNVLRQTIAGMKYKPDIDKIKQPVLVLASKADRLLACDCVDKVATSLKAELRWHETSGHGIPIDAPEWLVEQMTNWLFQPRAKSQILRA
jgi:pimeloyl-[acyl-carrier protein] methyl ester esterase